MVTGGSLEWDGLVKLVGLATSESPRATLRWFYLQLLHANWHRNVIFTLIWRIFSAKALGRSSTALLSLKMSFFSCKITIRHAWVIFSMFCYPKVISFYWYSQILTFEQLWLQMVDIWRNCSILKFTQSRRQKVIVFCADTMFRPQFCGQNAHFCKKSLHGIFSNLIKILCAKNWVKIRNFSRSLGMSILL